MQINAAIQKLTQVIQQDSSTSEEMSTSAEELAGQAEVLKDNISFFKLETGDRTVSFGLHKIDVPISQVRVEISMDDSNDNYERY